MQRELAGNGAGVQATKPTAERQTASAAIMRDRLGASAARRLLGMSDPLRSGVLRGNRIPDNTIICRSP